MTARDQLGLFAARVGELRRAPLLRNNGLGSRISIRWTAVEGLGFSTTMPDEERLRSYLLTFRQFVSEKEPIFLGRIYGLCHRHLTSDTIKGYLIHSREAWRKSVAGQGMKLVLDGREITPEYAADLWINGHYFHSDEEKRRTLIRLVKPEALLVRQRFIDYVIDATRQVIYVGNVVTIGLREGLFATP